MYSPAFAFNLRENYLKTVMAWLKGKFNTNYLYLFLLNL